MRVRGRKRETTRRRMRLSRESPKNNTVFSKDDDDDDGRGVRIPGDDQILLGNGMTSLILLSSSTLKELGGEKAEKRGERGKKIARPGTQRQNHLARLAYIFQQ